MSVLLPLIAAVFAAPLPTIDDFLKDKDTEARAGLVRSHLSAKSGQVYLELPRADGRGVIGEYLLNSAIRTGLGSNDIGLDRGKLGGERVVTLRRVADRVVFEQPNLSFRAISNDIEEVKAVRESFATSIVWAAKVAAEDADGTTLIDFTPYLMKDVTDIGGSISGSVDSSRSMVDPEQCLAFPKNLEFETILTFNVNSPNRFVRETAPDPNSVTMVQHVSLIELPDEGYTPREFDPRIGMFAVTFLDYAAPLDKPMLKKWVARHRLEKVNPNAARSRVKEPIIYYLDPGAPEPVRSALLEGGRWWAEAFDKAGFIDAFRVEVLPEGAHPLDVRYNVIQWVHRSTRGWSYGSSVTDPRTGEIIKGHVSLGSLRVRQDIMIFEGLFGADKTGRGGANDPIVMSLARIRQLSAHEIGHTLGFAHNFAGSSYGRESVMDYPSPWIKAQGGQLDASEVYDVGIGEWDIHAVKWGYGQFPAGREQAELDKIIADGIAKGYVFSSDQDARAAGSSDPRSALWDNGDDPVTELENVLRVRRVALQNFGSHNLPDGQPIALLHEVFVPIYLYHRYQVEAAAKMLGGLYYDNKVKGDGLPLPRVAPSGDQNRALAALIECLQAEQLAIRPEVLNLLAPRPAGYGTNREMLAGATTPAFDQISAAETAAEVVLTYLLDPTRLARMDAQRAQNPLNPGAAVVIDRLLEGVHADGGHAPIRNVEITQAVRALAAHHLMRLEANEANPVSLRSSAREGLKRMSASLKAEAGVWNWKTSEFLAGEIDRFLNRPAGVDFPIPPAPAIPPGSPIGSGCDCGHF